MRVVIDNHPWAYRDDEGQQLELLSAPDWTCPGGTCVCHPTDSGDETRAHTIRLYDAQNRPMPGARCRVFHNGIQLNSAPLATGHEMEFELPVEAQFLDVEWAPGHQPRIHPYPFRKRYYVNMTDRRKDATRRRLHNLGFSVGRTLRENIQDFQWTYEQEETGELDHIEEVLYRYHDDGALPPVPHHAPAPSAEAKAFHQRVPQPPLPPPPLPPGVSPNATPRIGAAANPHLGRLDLTVQMAFLLEARKRRTVNEQTRGPWQHHGSRARRFVENARVRVFDTTLLSTFKIQVAEERSNANGRVRIRISPLATGDRLEVHVLPPDDSVNPTDGPAAPGLTRHLLPAMEAVFLPSRGRFQQLTAERDAADAARDVAREASAKRDRAALQAAVNVDFEAAIPEVLLRPFRFFVEMTAPSGVIDLTKDVELEGLDRRASPAFMHVLNRVALPPSLAIDWKPDWVRAPVQLLDWARAPEDCPVFFDNATRPTGLTGEPILVIHQVGGPEDMGATINDFTSIAELQSIHYLIDLDGHAVKFIDDHYEANHAGATSLWERQTRVNERSIGIEMLHSDEVREAKSGPRPREFPQAQTVELMRLVNDIGAVSRIEPRRVIGHGEEQTLTHGFETSNSALGGRILNDPGRRFEWAVLGDLTFRQLGSPVGATLLGVPSGSGRIMLAPRGAGAANVDGLEVKRRLLEIGYSVSTNNAASGQLTATLDDAALRALASFQMRILELSERNQIVIPEPSSKPTPIVGFVWIDFKTAQALVDISSRMT